MFGPPRAKGLPKFQTPYGIIEGVIENVLPELRIHGLPMRFSDLVNARPMIRGALPRHVSPNVFGQVFIKDILRGVLEGVSHPRVCRKVHCAMPFGGNGYVAPPPFLGRDVVKILIESGIVGYPSMVFNLPPWGVFRVPHPFQPI